MTGLQLSRRRFLQVVLGTSAFVGLARGQTATFELGGKVSGWLGQSPAPIEGETNPTLRMKAGKDYVIAWENLDGNSHNVTIGDGDGNVLERTQVVESTGATQTLEFTAKPEMETYFSEFDPETMRGKIEVVQPTTTTTGTANNTTGTTPISTTTATTPSSVPSTSPTASSSPSSTAPSTTSDSNTDGGGLPGFGWLVGLGSLATVAYLLGRDE